ncbi:hypothetical protein VNO77_29523 [Canavalia gladiata]|uniref:Uncharacterized protein n=1 Tax=Canavalia gladiata TaxID=3824 RepID=A0AAN9KYG2_CANGL
MREEERVRFYKRRRNVHMMLMMTLFFLLFLIPQATAKEMKQKKRSMDDLKPWKAGQDPLQLKNMKVHFSYIKENNILTNFLHHCYVAAMDSCMAMSPGEFEKHKKLPQKNSMLKNGGVQAEFAKSNMVIKHIPSSLRRRRYRRRLFQIRPSPLSVMSNAHDL